MADEVKKKRGRPPLTPEERELHRIEKNKRDNERRKAQGWATQKKYHAEVVDTIKFTIPKGKREVLKGIAEERNTSMTAIIIKALEDKYNISLK